MTSAPHGLKDAFTPLDGLKDAFSPLDGGKDAFSPLVDARVGVVTEVVERVRGAGMPLGWVGYSAKVADSARAGLAPSDRFGFGAALGDPDAARAAALGEAVERYCGNQMPAALPTASYTALRAKGIDTIDPAMLALYSSRQYASAGFPFVPSTRDLEVAWVPGTDLHTGGETLVPASLVYLNYFRGPHASEPPTNALCYAGIATGPSREQARLRALEELFERDASTVWWRSGAPAHRITAADWLTDAFAAPGAGDRRLRLFRVPSPFAAPVLAAFIEDRDRIGFGTACRADPVAAARKALVEAFAVLELTGELADPDSALWRASEAGLLGARTFAPRRDDHAYADAFRTDFRDLTDLPAIAQLYLDPRMRGAPLDRLRRDEPCDTLAAEPIREPMRHYLAELDAEGLRAVAVDLTTPDVRAAGLHVTRVVVPGLYGNAPPAFDHLGGERLYTVPVERGWVEGPLTEDTLFRYPIPLA